MVMERDQREGKKGGYTAWSYCKALEEGLLPSYDGTRYFQQDNSRLYTAQKTDDWLLDNAIEVLPFWPAHSPDLNPIKHVWALLKRNMQRLFPDIWN